MGPQGLQAPLLLAAGELPPEPELEPARSAAAGEVALGEREASEERSGAAARGGSQAPVALEASGPLPQGSAAAPARPPLPAGSCGACSGGWALAPAGWRLPGPAAAHAPAARLLAAGRLARRSARRSSW